MIFTPLSLKGAFVIEPERFEDERGYFARSWCRREFLDHGLDAEIAQSSVSFNRKRGTIRGMHYQIPPSAESKSIRCTRGRLFDVMIDLRPRSATFLRWAGFELSPENGKMLFIPKGFAHGFQSLTDETEIAYQISEFYAPAEGRGVRWDDPLFGIEWPDPVRVISERDRSYPDSDPEQFAEFDDLGAPD